MITFLKNIWNLYDGEKQQRQRQLHLDAEQRYLVELFAKEEIEQEKLKEMGTTSKWDKKENPKTMEDGKTNCYKRTGIVTKLNSNNGIIDYILFFDMSDTNLLSSNLKVGSQVDYLVYKNPKTDHETVIKVEQVIDNYWDKDMYTEEKIEQQAAVLRKENPKYFNTQQRSEIGLITERKSDSIVIETEHKSVNVKLDSIEIDFVPKMGDRVCLCCNVQVDEHFTDKQGEILEVKSIYPARMMKQEKCTVKRLFTEYAQLDEKYYVPYDVLPNTIKLTVGDIVTVDLIECERGVFDWRCIKLHKVLENFIPALSTEPKERKRDSRPIAISNSLCCIFSNTFEEQMLDVDVTNQSDRLMKVVSIGMNKNHNKSVCLIDPPPNDMSFDLLPGDMRILRFKVQPTFFGEFSEAFTINFDSFSVRRCIRLIVCDGEKAAAEAKAKQDAYMNDTLPVLLNNNNGNNKYLVRQNAYQVWSKRNEVVPGTSLLTKRRFVAVHIDVYEVPERLRICYLTTERREDMYNNVEGYFPSLATELNMSNYTERFRVLLHLEEIEQFISFRSYDSERSFFTREGEYLALHIKNLAEKRPSLVIGDTVRAINLWEQGQERTPDYDGCIHKVLQDRVLLKFNPGFHAKYKGEDYRLRFYFSRFVFRKMHHSISRVPSLLGAQFLFPMRVQLRDQPQLDVKLDDNYNMQLNGRHLPWINEDLNKVQKLAILNILRGEVELMPYVIFGPPGTGKTITVIEIILQLLKNLPSARILVGTPSNSSADLIATRLINSNALQPGDFVRLVSQNMIERNIISDHLMPYCVTPDFGSDGSCENSMIITDSGLKLRCQMKTLGRHRVIISTCSTLGNFIMMGFPDTHFTHAIIDECGQCTEPEVMVPISLICRKRGQVVLAGDPHQLNAIITNPLAGQRGLQISFLERITARSPYAKDMLRFPKTCGYDPRLLTKLVNNYRALPSILDVYNELFYDNELQPMVDEENSREAHALSELDNMLPNSATRPKSHGTFFYGMRSENKQEPDSPSWYNPLEAKNVFLLTMQLYSKSIDPENIGIITPYSRQVKHIRTLFRAEGIVMPKVGSVEEFQGQERDIIIISTVRSTESLIANDIRHSLGFVRSSKRMNVAISRARYLIFVFGNPQLLALDDCWRTYITYCHDNDACLGELPEGIFDIDELAEKNQLVSK